MYDDRIGAQGMKLTAKDTHPAQDVARPSHTQMFILEDLLPYCAISLVGQDCRFLKPIQTYAIVKGHGRMKLF